MHRTKHLTRHGPRERLLLRFLDPFVGRVDVTDFASMYVGKVGRTAAGELVAQRLLERRMHGANLGVSERRVVVRGAVASAFTPLELRDKESDRLVDIVIRRTVASALSSLDLVQGGAKLDREDGPGGSKGVVVGLGDGFLDEFSIVLADISNETLEDDLRLTIGASFLADERYRAAMGSYKVGLSRGSKVLAKPLFEQGVNLSIGRLHTGDGESHAANTSTKDVSEP